MNIRTFAQKLFLLSALACIPFTLSAVWKFDEGSEEAQLMDDLGKAAGLQGGKVVMPPLKGALEGAHTAFHGLKKFWESKQTDGDKADLEAVGASLETILTKLVPMLDMAGGLVSESVKRSERFGELRSRVESESLQNVLTAAETANKQQLSLYLKKHDTLVALMFLVSTLQEAVVYNANRSLQRAAKKHLSREDLMRLFTIETM